MSDTKQNNKIDPCIWLDDAPDKHEGGWRNLYFACDGSTRASNKVFPTKEKADEKSTQVFQWAHRTNSVCPEWDNKPWSEISHAIALPVKEKP